MTKYQRMFYDIKTTGGYKTIGEDIDYKIIVDANQQYVILQFQESNQKRDWYHNLSILPVPLKLENKIVWTTRGYACAYKSMNSIPLKEFYAACLQHGSYKWIIRGWSFGSAMAKIATRHFYIMTGLSIGELVTYGDVKCWLNPFIHNKALKYTFATHEFTTPNDFVTWLVPFYHRTNKCSVGEKFSFKKAWNVVKYHTEYDTYDYSMYE